MSQKTAKIKRKLNNVEIITTDTIKKLNNEVDKTNFLPDYGTWYYQCFGMTDHLIVIDDPFIFWTEQEGYINFQTPDKAGTIITTTTLAKKYAKNKIFKGTIIPSPDEKYLTPETKEWVLPFRIKTEDSVKSNNRGFGK